MLDFRLFLHFFFKNWSSCEWANMRNYEAFLALLRGLNDLTHQIYYQLTIAFQFSVCLNVITTFFVNSLPLCKNGLLRYFTTGGSYLNWCV